MMTATRNKPLPEFATVLLAAVSAFCVYTCMYAFRKPFTAATYTEDALWGIDYKIWLVIAQTIGYTCSKFFGIGFIGGLQQDKRAWTIIKLISIAWVALLLFAVVPAAVNIVFLLINGFPLGVIYGLVFSYLEGRRTTELLGAVLTASFIFASGFTQSAGKFVMLEWNFSERWMPFITGLLFMGPLVLFTWILEKTPKPSVEDRLARTERKPMTKAERKSFIKKFIPGLFLLIAAYVLLTIIRDYRTNFASDMWKEMGYDANALVYTQSELPATLTVLILMSLLVFIRNNMQAFLINHFLIILGLLLAAGSTILFTQNKLSPFVWMSITSVGLYIGYVPFNCMLFERLIAGFKYVGNAGFVIYIADSFGYLGSNLILIAKNFLPLNVSWTDFYIRLIFVSAVAGVLLVSCSAIYFTRKYQRYFPLRNPGLKYG